MKIMHIGSALLGWRLGDDARGWRLSRVLGSSDGPQSRFELQFLLLSGRTFPSVHFHDGPSRTVRGAAQAIN